MNIAITGASGYLGRGLIHAFLTQGHQVMSLSRQACETNWIQFALQDNPEILPWDNIDVLVHAAFDFSARSWQETKKYNIIPSINLLDEAAQRNVRILILISSLSSFPGTTSHYGRAKLALEQHVVSLGGHVIRPGLIWGDEQGGIMGAMQTMVSRIHFIPYPTGGQNNIQYLVHRADVADAVVWVAEHADSTNQIISVAHPHPWRMPEILANLSKHTGIRNRFIPVHWALLFIPLRALELLGFRLHLRSDSLWGMVHGTPLHDLGPLPSGKVARPFQ
jgi:nucleoside-diphosphate-sugar epimerase